MSFVVFPSNSKETLRGLRILVIDMSELIRSPTDDEDCTCVEVNEFDTFGTTYSKTNEINSMV